MKFLDSWQNRKLEPKCQPSGYCSPAGGSEKPSMAFLLFSEPSLYKTKALIHNWPRTFILNKAENLPVCHIFAPVNIQINQRLPIYYSPKLPYVALFNLVNTPSLGKS